MQKVVMSAILSAVLLLSSTSLWAQAPVESLVLPAEHTAGTRVQARESLLAEKPDTVQVLSRTGQQIIKPVGEPAPQHTKQEAPLLKRRIYRVR